MNYLKTNDTSFSLYLQQENSNDDCNATNTVQELNVDKPVESEWAKYLDSPKKECLSDAQNSPDSIHETENMITNENSLCNATNNDLCDSESIVDDLNFVSENIVDRTEKICSTSYNYRIEDKCNLQDSDKSNKDHNDIANIFETYSELDDPIDI